MDDAACRRAYGMTWDELVALILTILQGLAAQRESRTAPKPPA
jgi:hypothetical protein